MMHIQSGHLRRTWLQIGRWTLCCLGGLCFIAILIGWFYLAPINKADSSTIEKFVNFNVVTGSNSRTIAKQLAAEKLIRSELAFLVALRYCGNDRHLKAGSYQLQQSMSLLQILNELQKGQVKLKSWTVPEGLTVRDIAGLWEAAGFGTAEAFLRATKSADLLRGSGPDRDSNYMSVEGYLFPNTYKFAKGTPVKTVVEMMLAEFNRQWDETLREKAKDLNMTRHEVVTLASIIEKEAQSGTERHRIASVFHNRLKRNWRLQADPTVIYALEHASDYATETYDDSKEIIAMHSQEKRPLTKADLKVDSPYNTYLYKGLPPGPISNPGIASIRAALHPEKTNYLYFVAIGNGLHHFSKTLSEHNRMIREIRRKAR